MINDNIKILVAYRIEQAEESLVASRVLLNKDLIRPSVNRSYYSMFYAVLALLATRKQETSKHSGAISLFDRVFVKSRIFPKEFSRWIHDAFDLRQRSDYTPRALIERDTANEVLRQAEKFINHTKVILDSIYDQDADT